MMILLTRLLLLIGIWSIFVSAQAIVLPGPGTASQALNEVTFEVAAEQWVTTKAAKVVVAVNAALSNERLANAYTDVTQKLQKLMGDASWHVTAFERSTDKTGLEQLNVVAEVRLTEAALATLKERLKNVSKPGETYSIASIDYTPTLAEREIARSLLRAQIYNQIKAELTQLNTAYPNQKYSVHQVNFFDGENGSTPRSLILVASETVNKQAALVAGVSNNLQLRARVVVATAPGGVTN